MPLISQGVIEIPISLKSLKKTKLRTETDRSSRPEVFYRKGVVKMSQI